MTTTRNYQITVTLARSNGHDITNGFLDAFVNECDPVGVEITGDDLTVHDITVPTVARHRFNHLLVATLDAVVESDMTAVSTEAAIHDALDILPACGMEVVTVAVSIA